jgi:glycosyltransferase involved in cell wall biosynthesis
MAHKADGCVCQTEGIMSWYKPILYSRTLTAVIPNSISNEVFKKTTGDKHNKIILTIGRLEAQKNHALLINAFAEIASEYPEYRLAIYGKGPLEKELKEQIESMELNGRVLMPGFTNDIVSVYSHSAIFVLTSNHEGMPNVLAEAMAMGLPCISTDCDGGGARELIKDGVSGILIPCNDKDSLIMALRTLIDNADYASFLAFNAESIRKRLNPTIIHTRWEKYLIQFTG